MRIVHVIPYFPPAIRFGGVPEAVYSLVTAQASLGNEITLLTTDAGLERDSHREGLTLEWKASKHLSAVGYFTGGQIFYLTNRYPRLSDRYKVFSASFWNRDIQARLASGVDILHFHEVHISGYRRLARSCQVKGIPTCLSCHGSLHPPVHRGYKYFLHGWFDPVLRRGWFNKVSAYFALCQNEKQQLLQCGAREERIHILPHGQPQFVPPFSKLPFPVSESPDMPTFLYLGRIHPAKGILTAIQAFCELVRGGIPARLICCGPEEGGLRQIRQICERHGISIIQNALLADPGIYCIAPLDRHSLPELFSKVDCTVCPSPYEAFGLVPVESVLCGVPIIVTSAYGCIEHLSWKNSISVIDPEDVPSMLRAMRDTSIRDKSKNGLPPLGNLLPSWDEIAREIEAIYKQVLR